MAVGVVEAQVKEAQAVDLRGREAAGAVLGGVVVVADVLLQRPQLLDGEEMPLGRGLGALHAATAGLGDGRSDVEAAQRVAQGHQRRARHAGEVPMVEQERRDLADSGLADADRADHARLAQLATDVACARWRKGENSVGAPVNLSPRAISTLPSANAGAEHTFPPI